MGDDYIDDTIARDRSMYALEEIAEQLGKLIEVLDKGSAPRLLCKSRCITSWSRGFNVYTCQVVGPHTYHQDDGHYWTNEEAEPKE